MEKNYKDLHVEVFRLIEMLTYNDVPMDVEKRITRIKDQYAILNKNKNNEWRLQLSLLKSDIENVDKLYEEITQKKNPLVIDTINGKTLRQIHNILKIYKLYIVFLVLIMVFIYSSS